MKKFLVVALSALLLLALFVPAMAEDGPKFTVAASAAKVKQGEDFTITVSVDQKISSKGFGLQWPGIVGASTPFEFVDGAWSELIDDEAMLAQVNPGNAAFAASKAFDIPAGTVLTLKVKVKADADLAVHALNVDFGSLRVENATFVGTSIEVYHDCVFSNEYSRDDNNHWKACTLGCDKKSAEGQHEFDGACGGTCTVCGYTRDVAHNYNVQKSDATHHWNQCACGAVDESSRTAHAGGTATCKEKAVCATCGTSYGELGAHGTTNDVKVSDADCKNPAQYKKVCSVCGEQVGGTFPVGEADPSKHTGGTATCKDKATCTHCGQPYGSVDPDNHTGNNTVTPAEPASCTKEGKTKQVKCNDCGEIITPSEVIPMTAHSGGTATCKEAAKCAVCGASYGEKDPANHTGNNTVTPAEPATCTKEGKTEEVKCNDCGKIITASQPVARTPHTPGQDNKCTVCGETVKPSTTTKNPNIPQNGDSSNVVLFVTLSIISVLTLGAIVITKRARASK